MRWWGTIKERQNAELGIGKDDMGGVKKKSGSGKGTWGARVRGGEYEKSKREKKN